MDDKQLRSIIRQITSIMKGIVFMVLLLLIIVIYTGYTLSPSWEFNKTPTVASSTKTVKSTQPDSDIVNGLHQPTGLKAGAGLNAVIQNCTSCHSSKLIIQNRMTKTGWLSTIKWMQETQNLWDLGENEESIVNYLATYYAPEKKGRRARLTNIEWYELE